MLYLNGKETIGLYHNGKALSELWKGTRLLWQAVRSCFGSGCWRNDKPWINDEGWKNG
ncbi:MAG: MFS transporter [Prevotella sp.]|nr:MFS transporter [Prevotella sp.]